MNTFILQMFNTTRIHVVSYEKHIVSGSTCQSMPDVRIRRILRLSFLYNYFVKLNLDTKLAMGLVYNIFYTCLKYCIIHNNSSKILYIKVIKSYKLTFFLIFPQQWIFSEQVTFFLSSVKWSFPEMVYLSC